MGEFGFTYCYLQIDVRGTDDYEIVDDTEYA